jgi:60 kDa SS-A/Ro ribonucleoprotein
MSSINRVSRNVARTFEGAAAKRISPEAKLNRVVMASMLFEGQFYIDGQKSADVIKDLVAKVDPKAVASLAIKAREDMKLRHVPLFLTRELARIGKLSHETLTSVIQRPDELGEFVSMYWADGKQPLSNQVKRGLANAFHKFNEYQFAKWNKSSAAVKLRDVLFLTHAKPNNDVEATLFKRIADEQLKTPDTWETELSGGADKGATFTRLMKENKLGALAFLRNLRNMTQSNVPEDVIRAYAAKVNTDRVLPFRFLAAARIVPQFEDMLEAMMLRSLESHEKLPGKTVLLIDVSGSMFGTKVSAKSDLDRFDAAAALAILAREICEEVEIYSFSDRKVRVPARRGMALVEAIRDSQLHSSTRTGDAVRSINANTQYDRCIIFTDEQSHDPVPNPKGIGYIINVAAYENGIGNATWTTINGMSEAVIDYIQQSEKTVD